MLKFVKIPTQNQGEVVIPVSDIHKANLCGATVAIEVKSLVPQQVDVFYTTWETLDEALEVING